MKATEQFETAADPGCPDFLGSGKDRYINFDKQLGRQRAFYLFNF
jgi:hypothetical protein